MVRTVLIQGILLWGLPAGVMACLLGWLFTDDSFWRSSLIYIPVFLVMGVMWGLGRWARQNTARKGGEDRPARDALEKELPEDER